MMGLEGAVLIPVMILGSAAIIYYGLIAVRQRQLDAQRGDDAAGS
jgi:NADH:ubiquinone oxidoreductase subunit 4 (subunit M)